MKTDDTKPEIRRVLRAQAGDREAFDQLLQSVERPLYHYIHSLVGNVALAEDVLQEVFILIYRKLRWLREAELFQPWAYRIASREAFKHLKRERRWTDQMVDEAALADLPAPSFPESEWMTPELIEQLIAQLSPASRAVIALHYLNDMPLAEIAAVLDIAEGTVKSRLAYGLESLRKKIVV